MKHRASPRFWSRYLALPVDVQRLADEKFRLLKEHPNHPSLQLKRIGRFWSCRVGLHYRALGISDDGAVVWFWIGTHAEYDQLLRR